MSASTQHKISKVRPPRVQITYDVEIGNSIEMRELPFVMGVIGDFSGDQENSLKLKERKFVEVDIDNFNDVLSSINPTLSLPVKNTLSDESTQETTLKVDLDFHHIDDFNPLNVVKKIPVLAKLYETRSLLKDLLTKLDGNEILEDLLADVIANTEKLQAVHQELVSSTPPTPSTSTYSGPESEI